MNLRHVGSALRVLVIATLVLSAFSGSAAQPTSVTDPATTPQAVDRASVVKEILNTWRDYKIPGDAENNTTLYGPFDLRVALKSATPEQLLDAKSARTFEDLVAALSRTTGADTRTPLVGGRSSLVIGDITDDMVFTPVTPCRIMDTRFQTVPARIGPDTGVQRLVTGSDYSAQGGVATSCGIPSSPKPAAVSLNVTTTNQSSTGSLRIIPSGAGNPPTAIMNYSPIQNIANAAVVGSATAGIAGNDIFVYSASAATDVVIDIMGYFSSPAATILDFQEVSTNVAQPLGNFTQFSGNCPAGFQVTGGGFAASLFNSVNMATNHRSGNQWLCQGTVTAATGFTCYAECARIPGH